MRAVRFDPAAWEDFQYWLETDKKTARRTVRLIGEIQRTPFDGLGKPEPLKGDLSGYWSRRITDEHRIVYRVTDDEVRILQARYHYR
ncbi:Txe/YoeB family addiction module toxin [Nocardiopsis aegyptia]|uniref:Txe/YoeB family addiction module toxin n=1 Tax=Nocardiopsis aegyptia TaxID=220378 RepID=UPI003671FA46